MEILTYIPGVVSGIVVTIPLVIALINYVKKAISEKNWQKIVRLIVSEMVAAEALFNTGAERKEYVMKMVCATAAEIGY